MADIPIDRTRAAWLFITVLLRLALAGLFITAAVIKLNDLNAFAKEIRQYQAVPDALSHVIANTVPWLEIAVAALLLLGPWRVESRVLLFAMLIGFTILKVSAEMRGLKIDCGCFGKDNLLARISSGVPGIFLNGGMLAALVIETIGSRVLGRRRPNRAADAVLPRSEAATAAAS